MKTSRMLSMIMFLYLFCIASARGQSIEISHIGLIETGEDAVLDDMSHCEADPYHFIAVYERSETGESVHYKNDCLNIFVRARGIEINGVDIPWKTSLDQDGEELRVYALDKGIYIEHTKYGSLRAREWLRTYFFSGSEIVTSFETFSVTGGHRDKHTLLDVKSSAAIKEIPRLFHNHLSDYLTREILSANSDYPALFVNGGLLYKGEETTLFISTQGVEINGKLRPWSQSDKNGERMVVTSKTDRVVSLSITHRQGMMNSITDSSTLSFSEGSVVFSETKIGKHVFSGNNYNVTTLANVVDAPSVDRMVEIVSPYLDTYLE